MTLVGPTVLAFSMILIIAGALHVANPSTLAATLVAHDIAEVSTSRFAARSWGVAEVLVGFAVVTAPWHETRGPSALAASGLYGLNAVIAFSLWRSAPSATTERVSRGNLIELAVVAYAVAGCLASFVGLFWQTRRPGDFIVASALAAVSALLPLVISRVSPSLRGA